MFGILFNFTSFFFSINIIAELLQWIRVFDEKEYSFRRVFVHFRDTKVGRSALFGKISLLKWFLIFLYIATIFSNVDEGYHFIVFGFYFLLSFGLVKRITSQNFIFPSLNANTLAIFFAVVFVESTLFLFLPLDPYLWMLLINKLLFVFVCIFVWVFSIFFDFLKDAQINRAITRIRQKPNLLTIAVVGSFGRGSTKEFISKVLSEKFDVLEVNSAFNNAFGIAKFINSKLTPSKQIFIAEMEDYKKEDIAEMAGIVSPKIVIVTGINEQKVSTFGNMDKVAASKMEAINGLSKDGIALFNGHGAYNKILFKITDKKKFIYTREGAGDITAKNIIETKFGLTFDVKVLGKTYKLSNIRLLGKSNIDNLLPAIFIAAYMGIDFTTIKKALAGIRPLKSAMEPKINDKGTVLIDDTHNANINSVLRAVSYVNLYKGEKIFVLEPLVELGRSAVEVHEKLGYAIGKSCDQLFLTNDNYRNAILKGIKKSGSGCLVAVASPVKISNFVMDNLRREDIVIFEGKESARSLSLIHSKLVHPRSSK